MAEPINYEPRKKRILRKSFEPGPQMINIIEPLALKKKKEYHWQTS